MLVIYYTDRMNPKPIKKTWTISTNRRKIIVQSTHEITYNGCNRLFVLSLKCYCELLLNDIQKPIVI